MFNPNPVRAAQPQVIQQLIGGDDDMDIDEGPRNNPWLARGRDVNMNATTSEADLERAIAASLEAQQNRYGAVDEDEELARILEASKHIR
jgi:hypothetical protein